MIFQSLTILDAKIIELQLRHDKRGFFARSFSAELYAESGVLHTIKQSSVAFNIKAGTLRGLHFQKKPNLEGKLIRCIRGKVYDVIVDLRKDSPTFSVCHTNILSADKYQILYVPPGCAHGYLTLEDNCELHYDMDCKYASESSAGILWNSSSLNIEWPLNDPIVSEQDEKWPEFKHNIDFL